MGQRVQFADDHLRGAVAAMYPGQEPTPVAAAKTLTRSNIFDDRSDGLISKPGKGSCHARTSQSVTPGLVRGGDAGDGLRADRQRPAVCRPQPGHRRRFAFADRCRDVDARPVTDAGNHRAPETISRSSRAWTASFPSTSSMLADAAPPHCRWIFAETQTFGPEVEEFHKTTFQNPPDGGLISAGRGGIPRRATPLFVPSTCWSTWSTAAGPRRPGRCSSAIGPPTPRSLHTRPAGACGRDYRVKSVVLVEVTFCAFPGSVPDIVMTNILAKVPGLAAALMVALASTSSPSGSGR